MMHEVRNSSITEREAAQRFVDAVHPGRKVGTWLVNPTRFQIVDDSRWYTVSLLPGYVGWGIETVNGSPI